MYARNVAIRLKPHTLSKNLEKVLDGAPKLRVWDVISSTFHRTAVAA